MACQTKQLLTSVEWWAITKSDDTRLHKWLQVFICFNGEIILRFYFQKKKRKLKLIKISFASVESIFW